MRPARAWLIFAVAFAIPFLACFWPVIGRDHQFGYRDAAHYYYPLHKRTTDQWKGGSVPLWDTGENGGMTLIGNPTAAVLYPAKVVFAIFPYAWAARVYILIHVALAFVTMGVLLRRLGVSIAGAAIGACSYAFGGPVLFQYCNAIYLVGAAWLPLGFLAAEGWLRRSDRRALAGLAVVLAMQCLGGDIQAAYLLGFFVVAADLCVVLVALDWRLTHKALILGLAAWIGIVLALAAWLPSLHVAAIPDATRPWLDRAVKLSVVLAPALLIWSRNRALGTPLARRYGGLLTAAIIGGAIASVQLLPVAELAAQSYRMADDNRMDVYGFSLEPYRLVESLWPGFFGIEYPEDRLWLLAIPPIDAHALWTASLYMGGLTLVLVIVSWRKGIDPPAWRLPMLIMVVVATALSLGRFGSPLWWVRYIPTLAKLLGPHGPSGSFFFRVEDGYVRDAFGSPYWLMTTLAPGFDGFRFPTKLLVFASLGMSALAALGWDRIARGDDRTGSRIAGVLAILSLAGLGLTFVIGSGLVAWWDRARMVPSIAGPIDAIGALWELRRSLIHAAVVMSASAFVIKAAIQEKGWAGPLTLVLLVADLSVANARIVWTVPQSEFDRTPRAAEAIASSEAETQMPGPFRIARLPEWHPIVWIRTRSADRLREIVAWERDTLQSGHGTLYGFAYTLTPGVLEPEAYLDLFQPWLASLDARAAAMIGLKAGAKVRYFPRRAFDLWGARYFILPVVPDDWLDANRAIAGFLLNSEPVIPAGGAAAATKRWREDEDWQVLRNPAAWPRAWVVHDVRFRSPMQPSTDESRALKRSLLHQADPFWTIPDRAVENPRSTAWVEVDDPKSVGFRGDGGPPAATESVRVISDEAGHVEIDAKLQRDGFVVLADSFAPGWYATVDGVNTPIWRTNRAMRGIVVPAGAHRVSFVYEPMSFRLGLIVSGIGLVAWGILIRSSRRSI